MARHTRVIMVRHGQAVHNLTGDFDLHDPPLSSQGELECQTLLSEKFRAEYPHAAEIDLVVASPLLRTLQTAQLGFPSYIKNDSIKKMVHALFQETSDKPCDTGSEDVSTKHEDFDFSQLDPGFCYKTHGFYSRSNLSERSLLARKWLYERDESCILVVTHSGFLRNLTPQDFPLTKNRDMYQNCEYREYIMTESHDDGTMGAPYKMVETEWSKELRKEKRAELVNVKSANGELLRIETISRETKDVKEVTVLPMQDLKMSDSDVRKMVGASKSTLNGLQLDKIDTAIMASQ